MFAAMVPRNFKTVVLVVFCGLMLIGCPKRLTDLGKDGAPRSPDDLLARISYAEKQVYAIKGEAKLIVDAPQGKGSIPVFAAVSHPALIHLEQLDFFGRPQGVLVTDGTRFGLYQAQEGKYFRGPASAANLGRFLPLAIPPAELAALMLGRAPRIPSESMTMHFDEGLQVFILVLTKGEVRQTLYVQPPSYRVTKSIVENLNAYDLAFADIGAQDGATVPRLISLVAANAKISLEWVWKEITVNEAPDLSLFEMEPPEGVPSTDVDAAGIPQGPDK